MKPVICYIDEEERDIDTFIQAMDPEFEVKDIHITDGMSMSDVMMQLKKREFNYLVVDYYLNQGARIDFRGDHVIADFSKATIGFPVMLLTSDDKGALRLAEGIDEKIIRNKDEYNPDKLDAFKERITKGIQTYEKRINDAQAEVERLAEKAETEQLTLDEEETYVELDEFLDESIDASAKKIPKELKKVTISNDDKLAAILDKADELIRVLEEK